MKSEVHRRKSQFCTICQKVVKMDMLRKKPDDEVAWLKCPDCDGIVPLLSASAKEMMGLKEEMVGTVVLDDCPEYEMSGCYEVGQVFYHKVWDDYGIVLQKGKESQKGRAIMVSFLKNGLKKIVEDYQLLEN
jgi:hypothetical protein